MTAAINGKIPVVVQLRRDGCVLLEEKPHRPISIRSSRSCRYYFSYLHNKEEKRVEEELDACPAMTAYRYITGAPQHQVPYSVFPLRDIWIKYVPHHSSHNP